MAKKHPYADILEEIRQHKKHLAALEKAVKSRPFNLTPEAHSAILAFVVAAKRTTIMAMDTDSNLKVDNDPKTTDK